jgi:hypothetical protein
MSFPKGAKILHLGVQHNNIQFWAEVDPNADHEMRKFVMYGTGHMIAPSLTHEYIGTIMLNQGLLVLHIFEIIS